MTQPTDHSIVRQAVKNRLDVVFAEKFDGAIVPLKQGALDALEQMVSVA